jgi:hypothetical protein
MVTHKSTSNHTPVLLAETLKALSVAADILRLSWKTAHRVVNYSASMPIRCPWKKQNKNWRNTGIPSGW